MINKEKAIGLIKNNVFFIIISSVLIGIFIKIINIQYDNNIHNLEGIAQVMKYIGFAFILITATVYIFCYKKKCLITGVKYIALSLFCVIYFFEMSRIEKKAPNFDRQYFLLGIYCIISITYYGFKYKIINRIIKKK